MGTKNVLNVLLLSATSMPALAGQVNVQIGVSESGETKREATPSAFVQYISDRTGTFKDVVQLTPFATAGVVKGRDHENEDRDVWLLGGGFRVTMKDRPANHWFLESQMFVNANETSSLAGHVQFGNGIGFAWKKAEVIIKHLSNARLKSPNDGETMLMFGYRF